MVWSAENMEEVKEKGKMHEINNRQKAELQTLLVNVLQAVKKKVFL